MRLKRLLVLPTVASSLAISAGLSGQDLSSAQEKASQTAVQNEIALIDATRRALIDDNDDSLANARLSAPADSALQANEGISIARRTAAVCGCLRNQLRLERAQKLARKALKQLSQISVDGTDAARVERLYWEAWLRAEILGEKEEALRLLGEAAKLVPDDPRLAYGNRNWSGGH